jgi:hypothetical protein
VYSCSVNKFLIYKQKLTWEINGVHNHHGCSGPLKYKKD